MRKYLTELVGTFFLMLTVGSTVLPPNDAGAFAPLAIGAVLMAMIFAGGHVSGGHYNPGVTLAVFLRGKCPGSDVPGYVIGQCVGAALAVAAVMLLKGNPIVDPMRIATMPALIAEFLFTFALCTVVLNVATSRSTSRNSFYGLAIGFTVLAGAYAVGPVSGGAFNPAVALGATLIGLFDPGTFGVYLIGHVAAAATAAGLFKVINPADV